eukprot:CAMPEP_0119105918 /NCGR_PEP_ID=MMETSP1180-20130426/3743_1 /TAXON_ID=3052 ORGANISM="Chlamydomonas cf sp, Strain CCMP681" /NCGR_SAMPLE_ID=MMETSP1180 /ASSEMBLY_ACC=CAM_ASM_000741 /LENGTH=55 /DNA_ID=CAMNT_0007091099 /DNA_START=646 /DNA_END=813 /DNA_ORIENTATION=-
MGAPRPCARNMMRFRYGPWSAKHSTTRSLLFTAPSLCLALAAAESNAFKIFSHAR